MPTSLVPQVRYLSVLRTRHVRIEPAVSASIARSHLTVSLFSAIERHTYSGSFSLAMCSSRCAGAQPLVSSFDRLEGLCLARCSSLSLRNVIARRKLATPAPRQSWAAVARSRACLSAAMCWLFQRVSLCWYSSSFSYFYSSSSPSSSSSTPSSRRRLCFCLAAHTLVLPDVSTCVGAVVLDSPVQRQVAQIACLFFNRRKKFLNKAPALGLSRSTTMSRSGQDNNGDMPNGRLRTCLS